MKSGCYVISHIAVCSDMRDVGTAKLIQPPNPVNTGLLLGVKTHRGRLQIDLPTCKVTSGPQIAGEGSPCLAIDVCRG